MKNIIAVIAIILVACTTADKPQPATAAQRENRKPTKEEMCRDPKTSPELLRLLCD